jgi:RNA polymerase sigma factor (sigma-70 family)
MRDREIVAAVVAGDPAGLAAAYDSYAAVLHGYCRTLLHEPADAADAVQDTFVIAAAKLADLRDPDRLRPWLYAVARNECHRRLRATARVAPLEAAGDMSDLAAEAPDATADRAGLRELVTSALAGLNGGDREVIELSLRHDLSGSDLADALGVPLNQAHALASRARAQLERSLGALLVARTGRRSCPELDAMLGRWDGQFTALLRKRVSRHVESCQTCGERKRRELSPAMLFSVLPLVTVPPGLRRQVLRLVSDSSPEAARYRDQVVQRAGEFTQSGFPVPVDVPVLPPPLPPEAEHHRRFRPNGTAFAAAAALLVLGAGGGAAYLLHHDRAVSAASGMPATVTVTASPSASTVPPSSVRRSVSPSPSISATPSTSASVAASPSRPPRPTHPASPAPSPGTLAVSATEIRMTQPAAGGPWSATFSITAEGGPVDYSITTPRAYLSISPQAYTLAEGVTQVITVSYVAVPDGPPPAFDNTLAVDPGGTEVIVEYPPAG